METLQDVPRLEVPTTHSDGGESQRSGTVTPAPERTQLDSHSEQDDARRPSTRTPTKVVVYRNSSLRQDQSADGDCAALADRDADVEIEQKETVYRRSPTLSLGLEDAAARTIDEDERRDDVLPDFEKLQTYNDRTTEVTEPAPAPHDRRPTDVHDTVQLSHVPDENLKLFEKLVSGGHLTLGGAEVTVEVREKRLRVEGTAEQIEAARMQALEVLTGVCCEPVDMSQKLLQLLTSDRGQRWLDDLLARHGGRVAVLFTRDTAGYITGQDDDVVSHAKSVLRKSLATDAIPFGTELSKFLQSGQWTDVVEKYESTWFLRVTRDDAAGQVVLDGCVRAVKHVGVEVRQLLGQNSRASRTIQLNSGDYRLIKQHFKAEVSQCLKNKQG